MKEEMTMRNEMMMRVKFRDFAADGGFTDILSKPLNFSGRGSVLEERAPVDMNARALERLMEQERLSARLQRMSLGELLYYVLAGEGMIADEPV